MNQEDIKKLLKNLHARRISPDTAFARLKKLPYENLGFANIDHHRSIRGGFPEAIYCEGKTADQLVAIIKKMTSAGSDVLGARLSPEMYKTIKKKISAKAVYYPTARILVCLKGKKRGKKGLINIVAAGTSDIPVAEEAAVTAETLGSRVERIYDVGVAGIHRLLDKIDQLGASRTIITVAGMDGALASVVGGLVDQPIIAVPTSIGYGASFNGLAPLLTMLNSCAVGVATVNIDNGFGAGCIAHRINLLGEKEAS